MTRRNFITQSAGLQAGDVFGRTAWGWESAPALSIATFRFDVTPPLGHSLCGGWITPAQRIDGRLEAIGLVIRGAGAPIVLCAVDWTGVLNSAHLAFRAALAEAAGTTPDRVAVQCVHQHDAPFACLDAQRIVAPHPELPPILDVDFFEATLQAGAAALSASLRHARPLTHVASAMAPVREVAANRRILGPDGRVQSMRRSRCVEAALRAEPEGLIDPHLRTVGFYSGNERIAACHYYACHPMSLYGKGEVSPDFCGEARQALQETEPGCTHLYFSGCGGNVTAGKYNDGTPEARRGLRDRMLDGLQRSIARLRPEPIRSVEWSTCELLPPPSPRWDADALRRQIADPSQPVLARNRPAFALAWLERVESGGPPLVLGALHVNDVSILNLPAELFVEYQLQAQRIGAGRFVACAAHGDGGPWYLPTREAFEQGGYEVGVTWSDERVEGVLLTAIERLLERDAHRRLPSARALAVAGGSSTHGAG